MFALQTLGIFTKAVLTSIASYEYMYIMKLSTRNR